MACHVSRLYRVFLAIGSTTILICLIIPTMPVAAHVLKQDNGVACILHIDPDDDPIANTTTRLTFSCSNDAGTFALQNYHLSATVMQQGKLIANTFVKPLTSRDPADGYAAVMFPHIGVYQIIVQGQDQTAAATHFQLTYNARIATDLNSNTSDTTESLTILMVEAVPLILLIMIAARMIILGPRYKKRSTS